MTIEKGKATATATMQDSDIMGISPMMGAMGERGIGPA
jgi:hypothetical protein